MVKLGGSVKSFQPKTWLILIMICNQNLVSPHNLLDIIHRGVSLHTHYWIFKIITSETFAEAFSRKFKKRYKECVKNLI